MLWRELNKLFLIFYKIYGIKKNNFEDKRIIFVLELIFGLIYNKLYKLFSLS